MPEFVHPPEKPGGEEGRKGVHLVLLHKLDPATASLWGTKESRLRFRRRRRTVASILDSV